MVWLKRSLIAGAVVAAVALTIRLHYSNRAIRRPERVELVVTGKDYRWHVRYPDGGGVLATQNDILDQRHLHVPVDTPVRLVLRSEDYIYTLELPELGVREIAVPDFEFEVEFVVRRTGVQALRGSQMCGYKHPELLGNLVVESWKDHTRFLRRTHKRDTE